MTDGSGVCEDCGYELAGLGADRCPECGADIRARGPFVLQPWPEWWSIGLRMCWPCVAVCIAVAAIIRTLALFSGALGWLVIAWPALLVLWATVAAAPPLNVADQVTLRCILRPGRARVRRSLTVLGIAINVALTWLIAGVAAAI